MCAVRSCREINKDRDEDQQRISEQAEETKAKGDELSDRSGGVFAIAAVVDHFSDAVVKNPIVGQKSKNPQLAEWHIKSLEDYPASSSCGRCGSATFRVALQVHGTKPGATPLGLEEAHRDLRISPVEFDEVAAELGRTLDGVKVPQRERDEVLSAFAAHKDEVTAGYVAAAKRG